MKTHTLIAALGLALLVSVPAFSGEDRSESESEAAMMEKKAEKYRLVQPWGKLESLTAEQKAQINEIHLQTLEKKRKLEEEEKQQIMAVLTDEQKTELGAMMEKEKNDRKMKEMERKQKKEETTEAKPQVAPADGM